MQPLQIETSAFLDAGLLRMRAARLCEVLGAHAVGALRQRLAVAEARGDTRTANDLHALLHECSDMLAWRGGAQDASQAIRAAYEGGLPARLRRDFAVRCEAMARLGPDGLMDAHPGRPPF
jgi:hypothetical protein